MSALTAAQKLLQTQRSLSLRLYKAILASHRALPPEMKTIGDAYVREEFQRHKTAKPEHLKPFFEQWLMYLEQMKEFDLQTIGQDLPDDTVVALSDDQREKLWTMRGEIDRLFGEDEENEGQQVENTTGDVNLTESSNEKVNNQATIDITSQHNVEISKDNRTENTSGPGLG